MQEFKIRTDLAVELKDDISNKNKESEGITFEEDFLLEGLVKITKVYVENENGMKKLGKDMGKYITIETKELAQPDTGYHREISKIIAKYVKELLPQKRKCKILVVGLGNREATPDALGPRVVDNLCVTRNMTDEYASEELINQCKKYEISGIVPGVMAQTGMESAEIVKGLVREIKPHIVIAIDSLAARSTSRLTTTIQISDTGINPGSGVGNHRSGLTKSTIGVPVIAIGIPTVVDAATIVNDTFENLLEIFSMSSKLKDMANVLRNFSANEKYQLIKEILEPGISTMYVTPKDIDETIKYISFTLSEALNIIWSEGI